VKLVDAPASDAADADEPRLPKDPEVPGDRGTGRRESLREDAGRTRAARELFEKPAARRLRDRMEDRLRRICNHLFTD
jgi:hypothetical protein